jgi:hypothetical protein
MKKTEQDIIAEAIGQSIPKKAHVGNCVRSFNKDGECSNPHLPYRDVSHFAVGNENATQISKDEFANVADIPEPLKKLHNHPDTIHMHDKENRVHMMYDPKKDIHHFFN